MTFEAVTALTLRESNRNVNNLINLLEANNDNKSKKASSFELIVHCHLQYLHTQWTGTARGRKASIDKGDFQQRRAVTFAFITICKAGRVQRRICEIRAKRGSDRKLMRTKHRAPFLRTTIGLPRK